MTSIHITINLDTDAFTDHTGTELARILTAYADRIRYDATTADSLPAVILRDVNGNTVGAVNIGPDDDRHPADCRYCGEASDDHSYTPTRLSHQD